MTTGSLAPPNGELARARLNGWKEIASHFGKGVRTVQRWEKELGLPVRRLGTGRSEIVYAFPDELDAWTARSASKTAETGDTSKPAPGDPAPAAPAVVAVEARHRLPRALVAAVAVIALVLALLFGWSATRPVHGPPADWAVSVDTLEVYDAAKRLVFSHHFDHRLADGSYNDAAREEGRTPVLVEDVDGDGQRDVLFGTITADGSASEFFIFDETGATLVGPLAPADRVSFGSRVRQDFGPPWQFKKAIVSGPRHDRSIWLVWTQSMFPSFVERIDRRGRRTAQFWSNGFIDHLSTGVVAGRPVLFIGSADNDTRNGGEAARGASLAIYDIGATRGAAPSLDDEHACATCPAERPRAFLVFPPVDVTSSSGAIPVVSRVAQDSGGQLLVATTQLGGVACFYRFDPNLTLLGAEFGDGMTALHERLERAGRLDHRFDPAEARQLLPVLSWDGARFVPVGTGERVVFAPR